MRKCILFFILLYLSSICVVNAQTSNANIYGFVRNVKGEPLEMVNVALRDYPFGTYTKKNGEYILGIPSNRDIRVVFTILGYEMTEKILSMKSGESMELNIVLQEKSEQLKEVVVESGARTTGNMVRIDPSIISSIPSIGVNTVESIINTLPGVIQTNELSSQYSVRGGSFDENLIYVNDIEIYRPFLIRSGQQEGLSFVNTDMVSSLEFSAGGFDAKFGDKMSSVLNITYKRPTQFRSTVSASLLGATAHLENISKDKRFTYNIGTRYKTFQYLFGSLEEKGEYFPSFIDLQAYLTYDLNKKWQLGFLGNISNNQFKFIPEEKKSEFGTWNIARGLNIYFEGQEVDRYATSTGALSLAFQPSNNLQLKFIGSAFRTHEEETFDIIAYYYFNELERDITSEQFGDSIGNLGIGMYHEHGRNFFDATVAEVTHKGIFKHNQHSLQWGVTYKQESVNDKTNEWEYRDSTGYSLPYNQSEVILYKASRTQYNHVQSRISGYIQDSYSFPLGIGYLMLTGGVRAHYWSFTGKTTISPRFSAVLQTGVNRSVEARLSAGWYHQPAFYRELKDLEGNVNPNIQTPRSFQVVAGTDITFTAWDRPFNFTGELYYKDMHNLIPYQYENVRVRYLSNQISDGFALGTDLKINGEFVSGTQSWASMSVMTTQEDIANDGHGYIPRPSDQRFKFSMFFQDYFPGNPAYQMNLTGHLITGMPYGPPKTERWKHTGRIKAYRRVDIGFLRMFASNGKNLVPKVKFFNHFNECSISIEILNVLDTENVSSYTWISDYDGYYYPVRNLLTGQMFNLKLSATF